VDVVALALLPLATGLRLGAITLLLPSAIARLVALWVAPLLRAVRSRLPLLRALAPLLRTHETSSIIIRFTRLARVARIRSAPTGLDVRGLCNRTRAGAVGRAQYFWVGATGAALSSRVLREHAPARRSAS
jgi:hypothetical protein